MDSQTNLHNRERIVHKKLFIPAILLVLILLGISTNYTQTQSQLKRISQRQRQGETVDHAENNNFKVNYEFVPDNFIESYKKDSVDRGEFFDELLEQELLRQQQVRQSENQSAIRQTDYLDQELKISSSSIPEQALLNYTSPTTTTTTTTSISTNDHTNDFFQRECFRARNNTVPKSLYKHLPPPYINLGFPKMGTSSLHKFFQCGGYKSYHHRCRRTDPYYSCANCVKDSLSEGGGGGEGLPTQPLRNCSDAQVYSQMDDGFFFPQLSHLQEFVDGYYSSYPNTTATTPNNNATFFLTFRPIQKWYASIKHWPPRKKGPHMDDRWKVMDLPGLPAGVGRDVYEFGDWFCKHVERVRDLIDDRNNKKKYENNKDDDDDDHSGHVVLVEVDIEDEGIGERMSDIFGVDEECWGRSNVNSLLHPELNN